MNTTETTTPEATEAAPSTRREWLPSHEVRTVTFRGRSFYAGDSGFTFWTEEDGSRVSQELSDLLDTALLTRRGL